MNVDDDQLDESLNTQEPSVEDVVLVICNQEFPTNIDDLRALSNIQDPFLQKLTLEWEDFAPLFTQQLLARLEQLAIEDVLLDFHKLFLLAINNTDTAVRILAARGLGLEDQPDYIKLLCWQLENDPVSSVRAEIIDVLGQWVISMEFGLLSEEDAEELQATLTGRIDDYEEDEEVRGRALEALGALSDEDIGELIGESYELGSHRLRVAAIRAMGRSASETWLQILIFNFDDEDSEIRAAAATAAGSLLMDDAVTPLAMLLDDSEVDVQIAAIHALGEIANDESEKILLRLKNETLNPEISKVAEEAIAQVHLMDAPVLDQGAPTNDLDDPELDILNKKPKNY
ncbi:MAG: HEAT repeat domain-containing protein [Dehalococcoidia bacterium]|nr:HEAT repeat domain-containing protein [Dehalococcoidia bacterium]